MSNVKSILLNLPPRLVAQLDDAANVLSLTRTDVIRRSLTRDLQFIVRNEIERALAYRQAVANDYEDWVGNQHAG